MKAFDSISQKFRLSYLIFTAILCVTFVSIFFYAGIHMEEMLVKSRLLEQLSLSIKQSGIQNHYAADSGINIYRFDTAPPELQAKATETVQEITVEVNGQNRELHFFTHQKEGQRYILTYLLEDHMALEDYPVLAIFEHFEAIFLQTLLLAVLLSFAIAILFSYVSSYQITKPLLILKNAVETDNESLSTLLHLPSEVGVLARVIDDKNQKLASYLLREQLFTGDVSHELRTPLTIIIGAAEVLESQLPLDSQQREFTRRIHHTATETSDIITALLMLSRTPEQLDAPRTIINSVITSEVERLQYLIGYKSVTCEIIADHSYAAMVRPELLKMAVGNLIKNAFQYTESGQVTITIDYDFITVVDSGIGIRESMTPHLFERFERGGIDDINAIEGSGLGLSIVQRIMVHLGWQLHYQPNASGGSTFKIQYKNALSQIDSNDYNNE
ncbi:sensor histidine kinase [Psychrobacter urativorans]|uniref:histidine kinase n=1 Tax=Psychrobacter urativorans TaxID=45610 RepID=A0A0M4T634_9GAMM|nr:HAMP domain-containing sensor histidine kinase [Psychrobacter urativorans]ALF58796.1 ATPase [Psychrobacter urativorans]